jgi:hypothetical protein
MGSNDLFFVTAVASSSVSFVRREFALVNSLPNP